MVLSLPRRHSELRIEKIEQNVIVHDPVRDYVHTLSDRAASVLDECDGTKTCEQIARTISQQVRAPYDRIAGEVAHLVATFADLALIESASTPAGRPV